MVGAQDDYTNQHTLEQRLQNVAKRMVSRHPAQQGRQGHPNMLNVQQHPPGTHQPTRDLSSTASNGFLNQLGLANVPQQQQQQQQQHPNNFPQLNGRGIAHTSPQLNAQAKGFASPNLTNEAGLGIGPSGAPHHPSGASGFKNHSMPQAGIQQAPGGLPNSLRGSVQQPGASLVPGSPSLHMPQGGLQPKIEPGSSTLPGMGPFPGMPEGSAAMPFVKTQAPTPSASPGPIMSNGAPVLLGRSRQNEWVPAQPANPPQVSPTRDWFLRTPGPRLTIRMRMFLMAASWRLLQKGARQHTVSLCSDSQSAYGLQPACSLSADLTWCVITIYCCLLGLQFPLLEH